MDVEEAFMHFHWSGVTISNILLGNVNSSHGDTSSVILSSVTIAVMYDSCRSGINLELVIVLDEVRIKSQPVDL